mgnify:FL=1
MSYPVGRCCAGDQCVASNHELRPEHKCPGCKEIVHTLCGEFDETADCLYCKQCYPCPNVNAVDVDGMNVNAVSVDGIGSPSKEISQRV